MSLVFKILQADRSDPYEEDYNVVRQAMLARASTVPAGPLFTVSTEDLADIYLRGLGSSRGHYCCDTCLRFIHQYGGLVWVGRGGDRHSCVWPTICGSGSAYQKAIHALKTEVEARPVQALAVLTDPVCGVASNRSPYGKLWSHFTVNIPKSCVWTPAFPHETPISVAAEHAQNWKLLDEALAVFSHQKDYQGRPLVQSLLTQLSGGGWERVEKHKPMLWWFHRLVQADRERCYGLSAILALEAAENPAWCHIKNTVVGEALSLLLSGKHYAAVKEWWNAVNAPVTYQRPVAPPKEGTINRAEQLFDSMKLGPSLQRRFARLEELPLMWTPLNGMYAGLPTGDCRLFGDLRARPHPVQMTWLEFVDKVLPFARGIKLRVGRRANSYGALVTAVHPDAFPILAWDSPSVRHPYSWYVRLGGFQPEHFNLTPGSLVRVTGIAHGPQKWGYNSLGDMAFVLLEGARDTRNVEGLALFAEIIRPELREVRSVIEAYSRDNSLQGAESATACSLFIGDNIRCFSMVLLVEEATGTTKEIQVVSYR